MSVSSLFAIVSLIIVVLIAFCWFYFNKTWRDKDVILKCDRLKLVPVEDTHFRTKWTPEIKPVTISPNDAVVLYGKIPGNEYPYWGISACRYNGRPTIYGDTVSSRRVSNHSSQDGIGVVMCSNVALFRYISKKLGQQWKEEKGRTMHFYPLYVDCGVWNLIFDVCLPSKSHPSPLIRCKKYYSPNIRHLEPKKLSLIPRDRVPKERDTLSHDNWDSSIHHSAEMKGYSIIKEISVHPKINPTSIPRDWIRNSSSTITLEPHQSLLVVAIDHIATNRSILSYVEFSTEGSGGKSSFGTYLTGSVLDRTHNSGGETRAHLIVYTPSKQSEYIYSPPDHTTPVYVSEYIGPEMSSGIAPSIDSVIPMRVFVIHTP